MNYTVSIISPVADTSMVESSWTDASTRKTYKNAFALASKCNFPSTLNAGDEFYFMIDNAAPQNCAVCLIYYPVPQKRLMIKVLDSPCNE